MKIVALEAENVKQLKAIKIEPDGSLVVIGGDNAAGKSSVLDSIEYALGGQKNLPSKPIREGQEKARIVLDLGDLIVTRTFTEKGSRLVVKNKDGNTFSSPQAMLDKLVGNLSFDPLEFCKMKDKDRLETLKKVVGLDFDELNEKYKEAFDNRTDINRRGKELKAQFEAIDIPDNIPDEEVSFSELSTKLTEAIDNNRQISELEDKIERNQKYLDQLNKQMIELAEKQSRLQKSIEIDEHKLNTFIKIDTTEIQNQINSSESLNSKVRDKKNKQKLKKQLLELGNKSKSLTEQLNLIDEQKRSMLENANFPIKGLGFGNDCVIYNDIPFEQCSTAEQIKISVAMGLVMNPELRILLIREGSLLDSKNLSMVAKMAEKVDAQVWIERVSKGEECSIIIEDGTIIKRKKNVKVAS